MPLVRRRRISLSLEDMSQMPAAVAADDFRAFHTESPVGMASDGARHSVEECGPPAAGFELVRCFVQGRGAGGAGVQSVGGHVLVVGPRVGSFGAFLPEDAELF